MSHHRLMTLGHGKIKPGGCFTCAHYGRRIDYGAHAMVWCETYQYVNSQPAGGCAFWMREIGADDGLPEP